MGIGETLRRDLAKLVMSSDGDQAKTACGTLQLWAGLKAGIKGATHDTGKMRLERAKQRQNEEEARRPSVEEGKD